MVCEGRKKNQRNEFVRLLLLSQPVLATVAGLFSVVLAEPHRFERGPIRARVTGSDGVSSQGDGRCPRCSVVVPGPGPVRPGGCESCRWKCPPGGGYLGRSRAPPAPGHLNVASTAPFPSPIDLFGTGFKGVSSGVAGRIRRLLPPSPYLGLCSDSLASG